MQSGESKMTIEEKRKILRRRLYEGEEALSMYEKYENAISVPNGISTSAKVFLTHLQHPKQKFHQFY